VIDLLYNFDFENKNDRSATKAKRLFEQYSVPHMGVGIAAKRRKGRSPLFGAQRRKWPRHSGVGAIASQSALLYMAAGHV